ncbi:lysophospholipid acyltransferase family protein [Parasediminibacterium sp. JCM 36343]|uniref:lysophospholipid acyltransferase family protein n=1 Tax=Parasediminibacterium sp. JCM 36343 TaxID=3374279 RepID=UPI00397A0AC2
MKQLLRILQTIYSIYGLLIFVMLMLIALPFVFLCLPFGKIKGGNLIYKVCKAWARCWYLLAGIRHRTIVEEAPNLNKQYIFVANHISYTDIPATVIAMNQPYRVLGKAEMVKYPVFGWIYKAAVILVDRESMAGRSKSIRAMQAALNKGISIFIFPEGTFNETGQPLKPFYDGAFRLAIQTKTPIKPLLFIDTVNRLHYSSVLSLSPGLSRVVYLPEIDTSQYTLQQVKELKENVYGMMEDGLRKYR